MMGSSLTWAQLDMQAIAKEQHTGYWGYKWILAIGVATSRGTQTTRALFLPWIPTVERHKPSWALLLALQVLPAHEGAEWGMIKTQHFSVTLRQISVFRINPQFPQSWCMILQEVYNISTRDSIFFSLPSLYSFSFSYFFSLLSSALILFLSVLLSDLLSL